MNSLASDPLMVLLSFAVMAGEGRFVYFVHGAPLLVVGLVVRVEDLICLLLGLTFLGCGRL